MESRKENDLATEANPKTLFMPRGSVKAKNVDSISTKNPTHTFEGSVLIL
jgi:hypothetical protein